MAMFLVLAALPGVLSHCQVTDEQCFVDNRDARVLSWPGKTAPMRKILTRESCMQTCKSAGYSLAGVEDGQQCFCGNATSASAQKGDGCNVPCAGNSAENCGANNRISVLKFTCSGPPDPTPPPLPPSPSPPPLPTPPTPAPVPPPAGAKNVLMIVVDDLRPQLGCFNVSVCGGMKMHTPNIDSLASRGLLFRNHYNQYSVCSPSRNSFMSGRRPDSTLTYNFQDDFRHAPGGDKMISLPEYFKVHGYNTTGCGKTYHGGRPKNFDEPQSWTQGVEYQGYNQGLGFCGEHCACALAANDTAHFTDDGLAARAIELLTSHKANDIGPWFVAVGFIRPHVDWSAPQRFWDLYPEDQCKGDLAKHKTAPPSAPKIAWVDGGYVDKKTADVGKDYHFSASVPVADPVANTWRRGYYAAVSYMDWNVGKVLDAIQQLGFADNTIISFHADHGYQLGEHSMWEKYTNWELAARVPWIVSDPAAAATHGHVTTALTENVDVYPTLAAAAGLPLPQIGCDDPGQCVEGDDATPLLADPAKDWKKAAISQYARCDKDSQTGYYKRCSGYKRADMQSMGYSVRTDRWRYTEWFPYNGNATPGVVDYNTTIARELYDHLGDTGSDMDFYDQKNVAEDPSNKGVVAELAQMIRGGWKKIRPPHVAKFHSRA